MASSMSAPRTRVDILGADGLMKEIYVASDRFQRTGAKAIGEVMRLVRNQVAKNITLTDHSLKALAKMGHPYAKRAPQSIHSPNWLVHAQTGTLYQALYAKMQIAARVIEGEVGIDVSRAPYAGSVEFGTPTMVSRPFMKNSLVQVTPQILPTFLKLFRETISYKKARLRR